MKIKERGVTNQLKTRRRRLTEHYSASKPTVNRIANGRNRKAKEALINFQNRRLPGADAKKLERLAGGLHLSGKDTIYFTWNSLKIL